jgi:hypothetical protein
MTIFQRCYDAIKNWKTPQWLKLLLAQLQALMIQILVQAGQAYIQFLQSKILEAASHNDWSNEEKFDYVFNAAKGGFVEFSITLKDAELNCIIEFLVAQLKKSGVIK